VVGIIGVQIFGGDRALQMMTSFNPRQNRKKVVKKITDFGGDRALQTTTSFNPRQLHHYHFEGEPSITFSIKELKVGREMQDTHVILAANMRQWGISNREHMCSHIENTCVLYMRPIVFTRDACDSSLQICAHGSGRATFVIEPEH
jgi:hypothetical protein